MKKAYLFTGQGSQYAGMGKDLLTINPQAEQYLSHANQIIGFDIATILTDGSDEDLRQTRITQPAVFLYSTIKAKLQNIEPSMTAGHSLGEFSALVAAKALAFDDALQLVYQRAIAMQQACNNTPSTMAAVIGFDDTKTEDILKTITDDICVPANYNCPGQLVISGTQTAIQTAITLLKEAGARRVLPLPVNGAFHSPIMEPAKKALEKAIRNTTFKKPICPIYQNTDAQPTQDPIAIQEKLIAQLTAPVRWTQTIQNMIANGATHFYEIGPKPTLSAFVRKIDSTAQIIED